MSPAHFPMVSKTIFASFDIFILMGPRESGLICGGVMASAGSPGSAGGSAAASFWRFLSAIISTVLFNSCSAIALDGSITSALWNSPAAPCRSPFFRNSNPRFTCNSPASNRTWFSLIL